MASPHGAQHTNVPLHFCVWNRKRVTGMSLQTQVAWKEFLKRRVGRTLILMFIAMFTHLVASRVLRSCVIIISV